MAFRSRARRVRSTLRAERRTLGQGLVALALSTLAGFASGLTLAHLTGRLDRDRTTSVAAVLLTAVAVVGVTRG
jgi:hypothetical protein